MTIVASRPEAGAVRPSGRRPGPGSAPAALLPPAALLAAAVLLAAACGATRTELRSAPVASLSEGITCVIEKGDEIGFEAVSVDRSEQRVVLERNDEEVRRSDPTFQRAVDQLTGRAADRTPGGSPGLAIEVRTFHEFFDRRGRTRRQRDASAAALAAADTLLSRCGEDAGR